MEGFGKAAVGLADIRPVQNLDHLVSREVDDRVGKIVLPFRELDEGHDHVGIGRRRHAGRVGSCDGERAVAILVTLLKDTNRLREAELLSRRVVAIFEASLGANHPNVATALNNLGQVLEDTKQLDEAESLMRRALAIDEQRYGRDHPDVARDLNNLAALLKATDRPGEAESLMRRRWSSGRSVWGQTTPISHRPSTTWRRC